MFNQLAKAIHLAALAHVEQKDKSGKPYILHSLRVMFNLSTDDEELMATAVLHDVLEDTYIKMQEIESSFSPRVVNLLKLLTRLENENYQQYIDRISTDPDAVKIKLADLRDNMDIARLQSFEEKDIKRIKKYIKAFNQLNNL